MPTFTIIGEPPDEAGMVGLHESDFSERLGTLCSARAPFPDVAQLRSAPAGKAPAPGTEPTEGQRQLIELLGDRPRILEVGIR
ncbi:MAG: hypothetical protein VW475_10615, partial [Curvibacter sp.]